MQLGMNLNLNLKLDIVLSPSKGNGRLESFWVESQRRYKIDYVSDTIDSLIQLTP